MNRTGTLKLLVCWAALASSVCAHADPPSTILVGTRLFLTTTTIHMERAVSTQTVHGMLQKRSRKGPVSVSLSSTVIEGYFAKSNFDPPADFSKPFGASSLDNGGSFCFFPAKGLMKVKHPLELLVSTELVSCLEINPNIVKRYERYRGEFDGHTSYGQPYYWPVEQAILMRDKEPVYSCTARYIEYLNHFWVSYNPKVGKMQLDEMCESEQMPPDEKADRLLANPNVFILWVPAD